MSTPIFKSRAWHRRHRVKFPLKNRWHIVRTRARFSWGETWEDLLYLVLG